MAKFVNGQRAAEPKKGSFILSIWTDMVGGNIVHVHTGGLLGEVDLSAKTEFGRYEAHITQYGRPLNVVADIKKLGTQKIENQLLPGQPKNLTVEVTDVIVDGTNSGLQEEYITALSDAEKAEFSHISYGDLRKKVLGAMGHPWTAMENACVHLANDILHLPEYKTIKNPGVPTLTSTIEGADITLNVNGHTLGKPIIELRYCAVNTAPTGYLYYCYWPGTPASYLSGD